MFDYKLGLLGYKLMLLDYKLKLFGYKLWCVCMFKDKLSHPLILGPRFLPTVCLCWPCCQTHPHEGLTCALCRLLGMWSPVLQLDSLGKVRMCVWVWVCWCVGNFWLCVSRILPCLGTFCEDHSSSHFSSPWILFTCICTKYCRYHVY